MTAYFNAGAPGTPRRVAAVLEAKPDQGVTAFKLQLTCGHERFFFGKGGLAPRRAYCLQCRPPFAAATRYALSNQEAF